MLPTQVMAVQTGLVSGTVSDVEGHPVAGARVYFRDPVNVTSVAADTDEQGHYTATGLAPGTYELRVLPPPGSKLLLATVPGIVVGAGEALVQEAFAL